jgi:UDP-N-acetylmuramoyl-tripeptide--D-alanyl-D-alanine ligase
MASIIPSNSANFTPDEVLSATPGSAAKFDGIARGVFTDSRAALAGGIFVAIRGERFNGHEFVRAAVAAGAKLCLVEEEISGLPPGATMRVPSTLRALGDLARFHRRRWGGQLLAVAGSVGKTTTRSSLAAVLRAADPRVHCPPGNLNNLIGVPMVLLGLVEAHAFGVVELGTSVSGEIETLTRLTEPDLAVLTRIALEHSEGLGDLDAIEHEEGALLRGLGSGARAVVNADDERCVRQLRTSPAERRVRFGLARAGSSAPEYGFSTAPGATARVTRLKLERPGQAMLELDSPLVGVPGGYALSAAVAAVETLLGRPLLMSEFECALASAELGEPGRLTPVELPDGGLVLDDTYNSSPASVESSIAVAAQLARARGGRLLLALGEMRELGALSAQAHREVGEHVAAASPALVVAFGGDAELFLSATRRSGLPSHFVPDALAALEIVENERRPGDVILVKASRSLRAERIVSGLSVRKSAAEGTTK